MDEGAKVVVLNLPNSLIRNTRTIAEKLEVTPELQTGLDKGIQQQLQQLIDSGELTLKVDAHLQPLLEPELDSTWIDAR